MTDKHHDKDKQPGQREELTPGVVPDTAYVLCLSDGRMFRTVNVIDRSNPNYLKVTSPNHPDEPHMWINVNHIVSYQETE